MQYWMFKRLAKFIHKSLRKRRFNVQSKTVDWNIFRIVHSETLGFFPQRAQRVWTILRQFSIFSVCFPADHFQLSWKSHKYFLIKLRHFYIYISLFKAANEIIFPENKCILDGIRDSGVVHRLRSFTAGLSR